MLTRNIIENCLIPHPAFEYGRNRIFQCFEYSRDTPEPICVAVVGESRTGKSRLIEEVRNGWKTKRTIEGLENPTVYIKVTNNPTVKGMVTQLLYSMGDPCFDKGTETVQTLRLKKLLRTSGTRALFLDEFQHLYNKRKGLVEEATDWAKNMVEDAQISLVVSGLPICIDMINSNEQLEGRFLNPVIMSRFLWSDPESRERFSSIIDAFGEVISEHFDIPDFNCEDMSFRFYCASGGLIGYVTKILRQLIWDASSDCRSCITLQHLEIAYKKAVWQPIVLNDSSNPFSQVFKSSDELFNLVAQIGTGVKPPVNKLVIGAASF